MRSFQAGCLAMVALGFVSCADAPDASQGQTNATSQDLLASVEESSTAQESGSTAKEGTVDIGALGFNMGRDDAPVRVVEMSDYGCGYCRKFHEETWPTIRKEYVDAGKIQWKFLPFVSGMFDNSAHASLAAECALEQGVPVYTKVNERIWDDQREWKGSTRPDAVLRTMVGEAGANLTRFDSCVREDRRHDRLAAANALARQVGVRGTPTFFLVGYPPIQGALPLETFRRILDLVYEDVTAGGTGR